MRLLLALVLLVICATRPVHAQPPLRTGPLMRPSAVVIHVHAEIADQRFVPLLTQGLSWLLAPTVRAVPSALPIADLRPAFGPMDAMALLERFVRSIDWDRAADSVQVLIVPDDIRLPTTRYNFAASAGGFGAPFRTIVVSLARMQPHRWGMSEDMDPALTAARVKRMVAKNTAKLAGYTASDRCLFAYPRNLEELDAMPESFCEPDVAILVTAGIVRTGF